MLLNDVLCACVESAGVTWWHIVLIVVGLIILCIVLVIAVPVRLFVSSTPKHRAHAAPSPAVQQPWQPQVERSNKFGSSMAGSLHWRSGRFDNQPVVMPQRTESDYVVRALRSNRVSWPYQYQPTPDVHPAAGTVKGLPPRRSTGLFSGLPFAAQKQRPVSAVDFVKPATDDLASIPSFRSRLPVSISSTLRYVTQ